jgi:hypothetical protein
MIEPFPAPSSDPRLDPRAFMKSETAQVWARDSRNGALRYLANGDADAMKEEVAAHWRCPVPGCASPALIAIAMLKKRQHLRHPNGGNHTDTESMAHIQAKWMIEEWARAQAPDAVVASEQAFGGRRSDVGVVWPDGAAVAFEVEYKNTAAGPWIEKRRDYEEQGVYGSWLLGHTSTHVVRVGELFRLNDVATALAERGLPVLLVNPFDRTIATVVVNGQDPAETERWYAEDVIDSVGRRLAGVGDRLGSLVVEHLDACALDPKRGLVTPTMLAVEAERAELEAEALEARQKAAKERKQALAPSGPLRASVTRGATWDASLTHCIHCAFREAVGLPVRQPSPGYMPWRDADGDLIAEPPSWWAGGLPLGRAVGT